MNLEEMINRDNKILANASDIKEIQKNIIKKYQKLMELSESITENLQLKDLCRSEVNDFFINRNFEKSSTNEKGVTFISDSTNYYKCQNTCISVTFSEYSKQECNIQLVYYSDKPIGKEFKFKVAKDYEYLFNWKFTPKLNETLVFVNDYKDIILSNKFIEDLHNLEQQIDENISYINENSKNLNDIKYVYALEDGQEFSCFEEVFKTL